MVSRQQRKTLQNAVTQLKALQNYKQVYTIDYLRELNKFGHLMREFKVHPSSEYKKDYIQSLRKNKHIKFYLDILHSNIKEINIGHGSKSQRDTNDNIMLREYNSGWVNNNSKVVLVDSQGHNYRCMVEYVVSEIRENKKGKLQVSEIYRPAHRSIDMILTENYRYNIVFGKFQDIPLQLNNNKTGPNREVKDHNTIETKDGNINYIILNKDINGVVDDLKIGESKIKEISGIYDTLIKKIKQKHPINDELEMVYEKLVPEYRKMLNAFISSIGF